MLLVMAESFTDKLWWCTWKTPLSLAILALWHSRERRWK